MAYPSAPLQNAFAVAGGKSAAPWLPDHSAGSAGPIPPNYRRLAPLPPMTRICITLASAGLILSQVVAGAERCAQRIERQQLQRAALMLTVAQEAE